MASSRAGVRALLQRLGAGAKRVVCEAGHQMKWLAETVKKGAKVQVHVGHPDEVKWIAASHGKTDKTDRVDARKLAELARAGLLARAVPLGEGPTRAMREVVSARQHLQAKRVAWRNTRRGDVLQEGHRLPAQCFTGARWRERLEQLTVSAPLTVILETFLRRVDARRVAEQGLRERLLAIQDRRYTLVETVPASGPLTARVVVSALDEATRCDDQKAVAH